MQQLRKENFISNRSRFTEFFDMSGLKTLAHYQPLNLTPIPFPAKQV
jgi:hypothetical protein